MFYEGPRSEEKLFTRGVLQKAHLAVNANICERCLQNDDSRRDVPRNLRIVGKTCSEKLGFLARGVNKSKDLERHVSGKARIISEM